MTIENNCSTGSIIGSEKKLKDLVGDADIRKLLEDAVSSGISGIALTDPAGNILYACGKAINEKDEAIKKPLHIEGEMAGYAVIKDNSSSKENLIKLAGVLEHAIKTILNSSLKRMLTTEVHEAIVNQSYEDLLQINRKLKISEGRYRHLANSLELKVQERTEELKLAHARLLQQEKMASVGQLAAGIAHEINNPLAFISSNINTLKNYVSKFIDMLNYCEEQEAQAGRKDKMRQKMKELKLDFIMRDSGELIAQTLEGAERVKKIVSDLKGFSHIDDSEKSIVDINREIDRTLNVLSHEIPHDAEIIKNFSPVPGFTCNPALICQVFMNIILNALQSKNKGLKLVIATLSGKDNISISISDNGPGIPDSIKERIFEPFFTTKEVGSATGMGLTVTYDIISMHGGRIEVESSKDHGTTFVILLPLEKKE